MKSIRLKDVFLADATVLLVALGLTTAFWLVQSLNIHEVDVSGDAR